MKTPTKDITSDSTMNKVTPSTVCDNEDKIARLQCIKVGLKYKKVKPRRIHYDDDDDDDDDDNNNQQAGREDAIKASSSFQRQQQQSIHNQKCVMSLATFSSLHSGISLESVTELTGAYSKEDNSPKYRSSSVNVNICRQCNQECDEHHIVCLSYNNNCNHIYHARCMIRYLMEGHNHCPICKEWYLRT